jgi:hypothetical protein
MVKLFPFRFMFKQKCEQQLRRRLCQLSTARCTDCYDSTTQLVTVFLLKLVKLPLVFIKPSLCCIQSTHRILFLKDTCLTSSNRLRLVLSVGFPYWFPKESFFFFFVSRGGKLKRMLAVQHCHWREVSHDYLIFIQWHDVNHMYIVPLRFKTSCKGRDIV